jgi:hypothetical protein
MYVGDEALKRVSAGRSETLQKPVVTNVGEPKAVPPDGQSDSKAISIAVYEEYDAPVFLTRAVMELQARNATQQLGEPFSA